MMLSQDRWYSLLFLSVLADVIPLFVVTDGIATVILWSLLEWQMLCQVVDVVTTVVFVAFWTDVIAKVADVIATIFDSSCFGSCCCQGG